MAQRLNHLTTRYLVLPQPTDLLRLDSKPNPAGQLPQVASSNGIRVAAELPRTISAGGAPAPFLDFEDWLDDLYDANRLFNKDLGVSHLPER